MLQLSLGIQGLERQSVRAKPSLGTQFSAWVPWGLDSSQTFGPCVFKASRFMSGFGLWTRKHHTLKKKVWIVSLSKQRKEGIGIMSVGLYRCRLSIKDLDSMVSHGLTHQLTGKSEVSLNMTAWLAGSTTVHDFGM